MFTIIWTPTQVEKLFGQWTRYVEGYGVSLASDLRRSYRVWLTVVAPGLNVKQGYNGHRRIEMAFDVRLAPGHNATSARVTIESLWRDGGVIEEYEQDLETTRRGHDGRTVGIEFENFYEFDPAVMDEALHHVFRYLGDAVQADLSREATDPGSS